MASQDKGSQDPGGAQESRTTPDESTEDAPKPTAENPPVLVQLVDSGEEEKPLHLEFPAPTFEQVGEYVSKWGVQLPGFSAEWQTRGEMQCIRCKVLGVSRTISVGIPGVVGIGASADYTEFFPRVHADLEVGGQNVLGHQHSHGGTSKAAVSLRGDGVHTSDQIRLPAVSYGSQKSVTQENVPGHLHETTTAAESRRLDGVLSSDRVHLPSMSYAYQKSVTREGVPVPNNIPYVVLGIFSGADGIPKERMVTVKNSSWLFWSLFWAIVRLRGIGYFLSLKDVKAFSIYKCNWKTGVHKRVSLEQKGTNDLRLLLLAYKSWWNSDRIGEGWTKWIHKTINYSSTDPRANTDGNSLSIEVVMGWSPFRISVVILLPTLLSLVIGIWFNSRDWNDLSTIQTAWGIASYVATAGGLIAALLGFISSIKDE